MPAKRRLLRRHELLISCEHGGNHIPARYRRAFVRAGRALASHAGYDPGALQLGRELATRLKAPFFYSTTSRLLVDLNRSLWHPRCFSRYARGLPPGARNELTERYYFPYRNALKDRVARALRRGRPVIHLSCHSFTPRLAGEWRLTDIGLLFDPARAHEALLCSAWRKALARTRLRVRRNHPYKGTDDGLTTDLRARFGPRYIGIEVEVNQKFPKGDPRRWRALRAALIDSFSEALRSL